MRNSGATIASWPTRNDFAMTTISASAVPPADIGARIVHLIDGIRHTNDLSAESVARLTGIPVSIDPSDKNRYGFGTMLDETWACNLASIPGREHGPPNRLVFSYDDLSQRSAEAVPVSAPEFEGFARALRDAGYTQSAIEGPRGALWGHRFQRDGVAVEVHTVREDAMAAEIRFRVSRLVVDASIAAEVGHG
jgi:hypothetical protein